MKLISCRLEDDSDFIKQTYIKEPIIETIEWLEKHREQVDEVIRQGYEKLDIIKKDERVYVLVRSCTHLGRDREFNLYHCNKHMVDTSWFQYGKHVEGKEFRGRNLDNQKEKYLEYLNGKYEIYKVIND